MPLLLVARTLQGAAGGMLAGLGYAVINAALPSSLWTRASALVSAMWGVSVIIGPAMGGLFAQFGIWRWAFGSLAVAAVAMAALVPGALPLSKSCASDSPSPAQIPVWSLMLLGAAALAISVAGVQSAPAAMAGVLVLGIALVVVFLAVDRKAKATVLPRAAFGPGPLKWMYGTISVLMATTMVDMYVPLFGQRLVGMAPVAAGFLGAVLAVGWTSSEIVSASADKTKMAARLVAASPATMAIGLGVTALGLAERPSWPQMGLWLGGLFIAGCGVGMAWPHLSAWIMGVDEDPVESGAAAAAINTVQLISGAFGAGLAGIVVNATSDDGLISARWLFAVFAVLAAVGVVASIRSRRCPAAVSPS
jgi:MFS family permease